MRKRQSGSQLVVTISRSSRSCSRTRVGTDTRPFSSSVCSYEPAKPLRASFPPFTTLVNRSTQAGVSLSSFPVVVLRGYPPIAGVTHLHTIGRADPLNGCNVAPWVDRHWGHQPVGSQRNQYFRFS